MAEGQISESVLVVEVGTVSTRAVLFDIVEGRFRFLASGNARTTAVAPYRNIGEGVRTALEELQRITSRTLLDENFQLIVPRSSDGKGVDRFAAIISAGGPIRTIVVGLLPDISVESARKLAQTTYSDILVEFSLNDQLKSEMRINQFLRARPDLVIVAGGTNGGASRSVMSLLESIGLASYTMAEKERPLILFVGNSDLRPEIETNLESISKISFAPNIHPDLDVESLGSAMPALADLFIEQRSRKYPGVSELKTWSVGKILPSATAFGRVVTFLSTSLSEKKAVLGVDLGASSTTLASALDGELSLSVFPELGLHSVANQLRVPGLIKEILRWITLDITPRELGAYLLNRSIQPGTLPMAPDDWELELAITRYILNQAVRKARPAFSPAIKAASDEILPSFEPVLATGGFFTRAPGRAHAVLALLDGLQPCGITTLILDQNQIAPAIGAAAGINPMLAVQVIDSSSFLNLGTVIAPITDVKNGLPVLRVRMTREDGQEEVFDVKKGMLEAVPVAYGSKIRLSLQPLHRADIGMGAAGRGGTLTVSGGALGVIFDARGRPLKPPKELAKRRELYRKWLGNLRAQEK